MTRVLDISKIYNDPIRFHKRSGTPLEPYKRIKESIVVDNYYALLNEIPNKYEKVKVTGLGRNFHEIENDFLDEDTFVVEYEKGRVKFHESLEGKTLNFEYLGEGVYLYPDSRVYITGEEGFPTVRDKFEDVDRSILVQKNRVDEQLIKVPQPSEVVDTRIDYNGKIFRVAKDRMDAEQKKIEEAYVDAKGKKHTSLKSRIDSLEFATETGFEDVENEQVDIWAAIGLIPGKITLETEKIESKFDNKVAVLNSKIELVPERIDLSVSEVREWADGKFSSQSSSINMLSDKMELKVDVNGLVSSINLSKDGVRIKGEKVWIDGEAKIDNAVIKSAHIDTISADKITAGTLDAGKITIRGGSATNYTTIKDDFFESRGRHERSWRGETTNHDVKIRMENGRVRARNDNENRSLYFSDNGISTFADGSGEYVHDVEKTSGTLEFFSYRYGTPRGVTLYSSGTFGVNARDTVIETTKNIEFRASGMLNFMNTNVRGTAIGVREPNTNFYIGVSGERGGELRVTDKRFFNDGNPRYMDVRAQFYRGRGLIDRSTGTFVYIGSDKGVRVTSRGVNSLDKIHYRPVYASGFHVRSSRSSKENITPAKVSGLSIIDKLNVVNFNYIDDSEKKLGFIAEDSREITVNKDGDFVDLSELTSHLTLAIQELSRELNVVKQQLKQK